MDREEIARGARLILDCEDPLAELAKEGIGFVREVTSESHTVSLMGVEASSSTKHFIRHRWTLPAAPVVQGSFVRESIKHKLIKLFKKEIQAGEARFDDLVFISTDTPEHTLAFLACKGIKVAIGALVESGGSLVIDGSTITIEIEDDLDPDVSPDRDTEATLLAHLAATVP